ncbi:hypothetical protein HR060_01670 [Catenovulum sp. SM1970]|nr:hypothetical protein [Marinifaba aquimaris]
MELPKLTELLRQASSEIELLEVEKNQAKRCICKQCLSKRYGDRIKHLIAHLPTEQLVKLAQPYRDDKPLLEHIDYQIEDGNYVFNTWYLLKRGRCCGNGCRNCPY